MKKCDRDQRLFEEGLVSLDGNGHAMKITTVALAAAAGFCVAVAAIVVGAIRRSRSSERSVPMAQSDDVEQLAPLAS